MNNKRMFPKGRKGNQYEHIEYTPYGELWVEEISSQVESLPFRFTGKELDEETGLYYYGTRYLDPKYSRWLSGDPALAEYVPQAPVNDKARKHNQKLPNGGIYNHLNSHVYHYSNNNPVKYSDPDGRTPRTCKTSNNRYYYVAPFSTIDGMVEASYGFIPFGGFIPKTLGRVFGFRKIEADDGISTLKNVGSMLMDATSLAGNSKILLNSLGKSAKWLKVAGKLANGVSSCITAHDIRREYKDSNGVGMDNIIDRLVGGELSSTSHENVSALYHFAKNRMETLVKNGEVDFSVSWDGSLTSYEWNPESIDALKEEIRSLKGLIE